MITVAVADVAASATVEVVVAAVADVGTMPEVLVEEEDDAAVAGGVALEVVVEVEDDDDVAVADVLVAPADWVDRGLAC